jgi:Bacterial PH domain
MPDLFPGEQVLFVTHRHLITLLIPLFLIGMSAFLLLTRACPIALDLQLDGRCPLIASGFGLIAALVFGLDWLTTRFVLTSERLILVQAPIWLRTRSLRLSTIEGLSLRQGILGRFLAFGDVIVDSAATQGGRMVLDFVPGPEELRDRIAAAIAARAT